MTTDQHQGPLLFSLAKAAGELSLSVRFLRKLARSGQLRVVRVGRRVLVQRSEMLRVSREGVCPMDGGL